VRLVRILLRASVTLKSCNTPGSKNGLTVGWDLRTQKKAFEFSHPRAPNDVTCVAAHPLRAAAAVGYGNGDVALFDVRGPGSLLHVMPLHTDQCRSVEFSPNGAYVASAAFDCNVIISEASTLAPTKVQRLLVLPLAPANLICSNCTRTGTRLCRRIGILLSPFCSLAASTRASSCGRSRCRDAASAVVFSIRPTFCCAGLGGLSLPPAPSSPPPSHPSASRHINNKVWGSVLVLRSRLSETPASLRHFSIVVFGGLCRQLLL
jgi:hypothetical protein